VRARLAACVNILPGVQSVYLWQGAEEVSEELILVIKTREERYPALERILLERHPYELPEIIATPITQGLAGYLGWIDESTHA
jgi:periplasmic divalent cation tolerance protein